MESYLNKSHCPYCGSNNIHSKGVDTKIKKEKQINWGDTLDDWPLLDFVGGFVWIVMKKQQYSSTTENSNTYHYCLKCNTVWDPIYLDQLKTIIKTLVDFEPNLSKHYHRIYVNRFIKEMNSLFNCIKKLKLDNKQKKKKEDTKNNEKTILEKAGFSTEIAILIYISFIIIMIFILFLMCAAMSTKIIIFLESKLLELHGLAKSLLFWGVTILLLIIMILLNILKFKQKEKQEEKEKIEKLEKEKQRLQKRIKKKAINFHRKNSHLVKPSI